MTKPKDLYNDFDIVKPVEGITPIPLHEITLDTLMATRALPKEQEHFLSAAIKNEDLFTQAWPFNPLRRMLDIAEEYELLSKATPCAIPGFLMATHRDKKNGPMVAIFEEATGTLAGAAHWKNIIVRDAFQCKGIGAEISIKAYDIGLFHPDLMNEQNYLSEGGRRLRRTAHRVAITRAIEKGIEVRSDVLKDYPDLKAKQKPRKGLGEILLDRVKTALNELGTTETISREPIKSNVLKNNYGQTIENPKP